MSRDDLIAALPWARVLPPKEFDSFAEEFVDTVETGTPADLAQLLSEWQQTAELYTDSRISSALTDPRT